MQNKLYCGRLMCLLLLALAVRGLAADVPATPPASPEFVVSEMRVQTIAGFTYVYGTTKTTIAAMAEPIGKLLPGLHEGAASGKLHTAGPVVFVYHDMMDLTSPFMLDIGIMAAPDSKEFGDYKVRKVEPFKCATAVYSGPINKIPEAYQKLMASIDTAKLKPTGNAREFYLYWEGAESPNNVVQIQMGIE